MKIQIKYLNGIRFKRFIISSAKRIDQMEQHLNDINVFPVADGDTGTNMSATMNSIVQGIEECKQSSFAEVSDTVANSALNGARGNSGAILAQFFQGLAEATKGKVRLSTDAFAKAAINAAEQARNAISNPQEGTIITVMKDWANYLVEHSPHTSDFVELFKKSLLKAKESLARTPEKLQILKKAGVVDAGAQGFVNLLEGIVSFIENGKIRSLKAISSTTGKIKNVSFREIDSGLSFQYCVECLIEGEKINRSAINRKLSLLGDSLILAGSNQKVHIHIHTDKPEEVISVLYQFGTIAKEKVEDMYQQHSELIASEKVKSIGLVTDSTCDLPAEIIKENDIQVVPVLIQVGKKSYLDRIEIDQKDFIRILQTSNEKLSTSQPSPTLFKEAYHKALQKYKSVISLHISEKLSGTIQGARTSCKGTEYEDRIHIIDSKTSSVALGLIVNEAAQLIRKGFELEEIINQLSQAIKNTEIFVAVPTLKYIIRSGRLNRTKGLLGTLLNLKPILTVDSQGYITEAAKVIGNKKVVVKTLDLAVKFARSLKNPRFSIAHVSALELAQWFSKEIHSRFPNSSKAIIAEASPALSVHIGVGGAAIAILGDQ